MPLSTQAQKLQDLYDAIIARGTGKGVQSAGQKGRNVSFSETSLEDMIKLYRMLWTQALGDETGLPLLNEFGQVAGARGMLRVRPF